MENDNKTNKNKTLILKTELVKDYEQIIKEIRGLAKEGHNELKPLYDAIDKYPTLKRFIGHFIMQFKVETWNSEDKETRALKQTYENLKEGIKPTKFKKVLYCLDCQEPFIASEGLKDAHEKLEFSMKFRKAEKLKKIVEKLSSEGNVTLFQHYRCKDHSLMMVENFNSVLTFKK